MHSWLANDAKRLKRIPRGIFAFLRNHHWSAPFQTGDLPIDMQHLRFEKRRAITSDNRACVWRCTQRARLDAQRSASKSITLEKCRRQSAISQRNAYCHSERSEESLVIRDRRRNIKQRCWKTGPHASHFVTALRST